MYSNPVLSSHFTVYRFPPVASVLTCVTDGMKLARMTVRNIPEESLLKCLVPMRIYLVP